MNLSIIIPCLNEVETISQCIKKCFLSIQKMGIEAEVIIADNGSSDGSIKIAQKLGAKVINVEQKGYGSAIIGGIKKARGKYIIMGDCDDSYDFLEIEKFYNKLIKGFVDFQ